VVLMAAGSIATCTNQNDEATAAVLDGISGWVVALGDNAYPDGSLATYQTCYEPTWGRHRSRTWAALGNHEYDLGNADGAFDYYGARAGPRGLGYYSFELGSWHIIVLNSNWTYVSTEKGSPQEQWLRSDLAANRTNCTLVVWHHPRFYQGSWNKNASVKPFWDALYEVGADVVVNAHFHIYERYAPQTPDGVMDPGRGIRQFIAGTGGGGHDALVQAAPNVEVRDNTSYGVLKLSLETESYIWEFVPADGSAFRDSGSARCH
jgi:hypothetical protein